MLFSGFELEPGIPGNSNFGFVVSMLSKSREIERPKHHLSKGLKRILDSESVHVHFDKILPRVIF